MSWCTGKSARCCRCALTRTISLGYWSLPLLERERLLGGNWKIRPSSGLFFKREWCEVLDAVPAELDVVRYCGIALCSATPR
jgi:hypothetical protein